MKRKLLIAFLVIICCIACAFSFTACGGEKPDNSGNGQGTVQTPPEEKPNDTEKPSVVEVTGVTLNKTTLALEVDDSETLSASVSPTNATDKTVTWKSSDSSVAKVENGKVTALKAGTATITATAGSKTATCKVTVVEKIIPHTHALTLVPSKAADCETVGNKAYYTCNCGKWFSDSNGKTEITDKSTVTLKATGHSYSNEWATSSTQHWHNAICGHTATTEKQDHNFENRVCVDCGYEKEMLTFKTLEVTDDTVYGKVSNATEDFSFIKEITADSGVIFYVCTDKACKNVIPSKTVDLKIGDNVFYVLADYRNDIKLYTVTLRRRPIHTVTFDTDGGTQIETQYIEEDKTVVEPDIEKRGYTFTSWTVNNEAIGFPYTIAEPVTVKANFTANNYSVNLDVNGGNDIEETKLSVTFDSRFDFPAAERVGYTFLGWYTGETQLTDTNGKSITKWTLTENKTAMAKWIINSYSFAVNKNIYFAGEINKPATSIVFDNDVTLTATTTYLGYIWQGWYNGNEKLTEELTYSFKMPAKNLSYTAKWELDERLSNFNFTSTETTCNIYGLKDESIMEVVIPDVVTSIGDSAFWGCSGMTSITIPDSVTSIGKYAFYNCSNLANIIIPDSIISIGVDAFTYSGLTSITIPNSVTSIEVGAFSSCSKLTSISIPDSVTSIGSHAFYNCSSLANVVIHDSIISIEGDAFKNCSVLANIYYNGDIASWCTLSGLGELMQYGSTNKTLFIDNKEVSGELIIPDNITSIGSCAFRGCKSLTGITIPNNITSIGSGAFSYCSNIQNATIPMSAISYIPKTNLKTLIITNGDHIDVATFKYCHSLTSVTILASATSIGQNAFYNCSSLTSVTIPVSVTYIGQEAFLGCSKLTNIYYGGTKAQWNSISKGYGWNSDTGWYTVYCTDGQAYD